LKRHAVGKGIFERREGNVIGDDRECRCVGGVGLGFQTHERSHQGDE
jgi:hypothetical protein